MKFRQTIIAVATTAALAVIPTTVAFGTTLKGDCKDGKQWNDYKYSAQCECKDDHDKDHRDRDRDHDKKYDHRDDSKKDEAKPMVKKEKASKEGRVLKTN